MTEHQMLHKVCNEIGYKTTMLNIENRGNCLVIKPNRIANIREIIFTQEFWDKYIDYYQMQGGNKIASVIASVLVTCKLAIQ